MPASNLFHTVQQYDILSVTVTVPVGSEPELGRAVDLSGAYGVGAKGIVVMSRDGAVTVRLEGISPVALAAAQTIVKGDKLTPNASGYLVKSTVATDPILGIALDTATASTLGQFIPMKNGQ